MHQGWSTYVWDMKDKVINILDPSFANGIESYLNEKHGVCVNIIPKALFDCINKFFGTWSCCGDIGCTKKFHDSNQYAIAKV